MNLYWFCSPGNEHLSVILANSEKEARQVLEEDGVDSCELRGTTKLDSGKVGMVASIWPHSCDFYLNDEPK